MRGKHTRSSDEGPDADLDCADFILPPDPESDNIISLQQPLDAIAVGMQLAQVYPLLQQLSRQVSDLAGQVKASKPNQASPAPQPRNDGHEVGWLDAEGARKYLSMSKNTFEKYVYSGEIKVKKYLVGGKNLFRKQELDLFVMTWEDKHLGFA